MKLRSLRNALLFCVLLSLPAFGQYGSGSPNGNPVDEAKVKIQKAKHEALVEQAKTLLERRESLEKELEDITAKLAKIERGEAVKLPNGGNYVLTAPSGTGWYLSGSTCANCFVTAQ